MAVLPPFTLAIDGDSTFTGRLSADWVPTLLRDLKTYPEAKGPIEIYNMGKGSQTSTSWGVPTAPLISALKPKFIITSGYELNGCVDFGGGPAVSRAQNIINLQAMVAEWRANIPGVDITFMTANPVSTTVATIRPTLADYYADTIALAATLEVGLIDNYAGWPKPLPDYLTAATVPFAVPETPGFLRMEGGTWNPADKSADITLGGGNLVVTTTTGVGIPAAVRGTNMFTGKRHVEAIPTYANQINVFGVGNLAASLAGFVGGSADSLGMRANGEVYRNGVLQGTVGFTPTTGTPFALEIDTPNQLVYFLQGTVRSAGFSVAAIAGDLYPMCSLAAPGNEFATNFTETPDGLHPIWEGAVDTYLYPNVLAWARAKMAALWPD